MSSNPSCVSVLLKSVTPTRILAPVTLVVDRTLNVRVPEAPGGRTPAGNGVVRDAERLGSTRVIDVWKSVPPTGAIIPLVAWYCTIGTAMFVPLVLVKVTETVPVQPKRRLLGLPIVTFSPPPLVAPVTVKPFFTEAS